MESKSASTPAGSGRAGATQLNPMSASNSSQKFNDKYSVGIKLGQGAFAEVKVGFVAIVCKTHKL